MLICTFINAYAWLIGSKVRIELPPSEIQYLILFLFLDAFVIFLFCLIRFLHKECAREKQEELRKWK